MNMEDLEQYVDSIWDYPLSLFNIPVEYMYFDQTIVVQVCDGISVEHSEGGDMFVWSKEDGSVEDYLYYDHADREFKLALLQLIVDIIAPEQIVGWK